MTIYPINIFPPGDGLVNGGLLNATLTNPPLSTDYGITASSDNYQIITTVTQVSDTVGITPSVRLPIANPSIYYIVNNSASGITVYPQTNQTIGGGPSYTQSAGTTIAFICSTPGQWFVINSGGGTPGSGNVFFGGNTIKNVLVSWADNATNPPTLQSTAASLDQFGNMDLGGLGNFTCQTFTANTSGSIGTEGNLIPCFTVYGSADLAGGLSVINGCEIDTLSVDAGATINGGLTTDTLNAGSISYTDLIVSGTTHLNGGATVLGGFSADTIEGPVTVTGGLGVTIVLTAQTLSVVQGETVTGGSTIDTLTVQADLFGNRIAASGYVHSATLSVTGASSLNTLTVSGASTFTGTVVANGGANIHNHLNANGFVALDLARFNIGASVTGGITTDNITVTSSADFQSDVTIGGNLTLPNNVTIGGTLEAGALLVDNNATINGSCTLQGSLSTNSITSTTFVHGATLSITGASSLNTATVGGASTFTGAITANGGATIHNHLNANGFVALDLARFNVGASVVGGLTTDSLTVQGGATIDGDVTMSGNLGVLNDLTVGGASELDGDVTIGGNLTLPNNVTIGGTLEAGTLEVDNDCTIGGSISIVNNISVNGGSDLNGDVTIGGNLNLPNNITVGGQIETGALIVDTDCTIGGSETITNGLLVGAVSTLEGGAVIGNSGPTSIEGGCTITAGCEIDTLTVDGTLAVGGAMTLNGVVVDFLTYTVIDAPVVVFDPSSAPFAYWLLDSSIAGPRTCTLAGLTAPGTVLPDAFNKINFVQDGTGGIAVVFTPPGGYTINWLNSSSDIPTAANSTCLVNFYWPGAGTIIYGQINPYS